MDGVLVDFNSAIKHLDPNTIQQYKGKLEQVPGIFSRMAPMPDAIESYLELIQTGNRYCNI